ncbi:Thymidylate synthase [compost metagenome]
MIKTYEGINPSQLYMNALTDLVRSGREVGPRGKGTKELRPVIFGFHDPNSRVTFLKGRLINPFFQLAEALWIIAGRSDVDWLTDYNANMAEFSDDGVYFNAPYGERLRFWGKNDASGYIHNPIDQLRDAFLKLKADPDTRQAYVSIYNPRFDNVEVQTKDRPCNLGIDFKIRDGKLDGMVFNRSNDLHWGTFGANLCQFSTILELMASWLGVEVGSYYQNTDSLHIYTDSYGHKITESVLKHYDMEEQFYPIVSHFQFKDEPRINSSFDGWHYQVSYYFNTLDEAVRGDHQMYELNTVFSSVLGSIGRKVTDPYLKMTIYSMIAYQSHKRGKNDFTIHALRHIPDGEWKVSMLRMLSKKLLHLESEGPNTQFEVRSQFRSLYQHLGDDIIDYIERKGE